MIIGIDLGTTHSLCSVWQDDKPCLIPNALGELLTPSVVGLDSRDQLILGRPAQDLLKEKNRYGISNFKRFMGSDKTFLLGTHALRAEELSALLIKQLIQDAELFLGKPVTEAVISVPAYFNDKQRKATRLAGELAGIKVERLINEPTAAALAYGINQGDDDSKFLIFDLGGGTFDVSIVELFEGIIEVHSSAGDNFLGGEDFLSALKTLVQNKLLEEYDLCTEAEEGAFSASINQLKHELSNRDYATFTYERGDHTYSLKISRHEFEETVTPLIERLRKPVSRAMSDAKIKPNDLDKVILVGGATRMPLIHNQVVKMFGKFPYNHLQPDETIALGAAVQAGLKSRHAALKDVVVTDVCPYTLGTSVRDHSTGGLKYLPIIERNCTIPISRVERVHTLRENQTLMDIDVYQGESFHLDDNIKLGEMTIRLPAHPLKIKEVDIRYSYDINGILEVETTAVDTGAKKSMVIANNESFFSEKDIQASLERLAQIKTHPKDKPENRQVMLRLIDLYTCSLSDERDHIGDCIEHFQHELASQDDERITEAREKIKEVLAAIEKDRF